MKKYVKLALCGMAAAALVTGCGKKDAEETTAAQTESSTAADSTETAAEEKADPGKLTKLGTYKGVEVKKNRSSGFREFWMPIRSILRLRIVRPRTVIL